MRLFKHFDEYKETQLTLQDNYEKIIQEFQPESIMAERQNENATVLEQAINNTDWASYALFYPDINTLDMELLKKHAHSNGKVILLQPNDPNIAEFKKYGHVIFDLVEYQEEAKKLIYSIVLGDGE